MNASPAPGHVSGTSGNASAVDAQLARLDKLGDDKEAKKAHLKALAAVDETVHAAVMERLKARKEEEERKRKLAEQSEAELDSLL